MATVMAMMPTVLLRKDYSDGNGNGGCDDGGGRHVGEDEDHCDHHDYDDDEDDEEEEEEEDDGNEGRQRRDQ